MIKIENLVKRYGNIIAANNLTLSLEENKVTVILGGSGSGKSTLIKLIVGLERPDAGRIIFDGKDVTRFKKRDLFELRKKTGMLFQGSALFNSFNLFENVAFPLREHTKLSESVIRTIVKIKLEMVGLRGVEHLMPAQLSGGMTKRVGLARSIVMDPKVVFYDEPTSGLDPISAGVINKLILDLNKNLGVTSIVVSHDIESAFTIADKIIILYYGDVIADGTPEEIKNSEDPRIIQFINGEPEGPIPFARTDKDFLEDILVQ